MHIFYAHMIGVKFHHIKFWKVQFLGIEIDPLCKMCKLGKIILTLLQDGDLQNKDTTSDDILGGSANLGFDSFMRGEGYPLELYKNRKGVLFPTAWE